LNTKNIWKIRETLKYDSKIRGEAVKLLRKVHRYMKDLSMEGLRVESITYGDWESSMRFIEKYGLLPADALHLAVALRLKVTSIA